MVAPNGAAIGDRPKAIGKTADEEESAPSAIVTDAPPGDDSIPVGPSAEEEAALLTQDRTSEQFYGQAPKPENLEPDAGDSSLPPMEDLVKRIPGPARELMEELFRARFVTVKRVPKSALKG